MGGTFRQKMSFPKKASQSNNRTDLAVKNFVIYKCAYLCPTHLQQQIYLNYIDV